MTPNLPPVLPGNKPDPVLFVGDNCILENHLTSSSLFFDFGSFPPPLSVQEELAKRWNSYPQLIARANGIGGESESSKPDEIRFADMTELVKEDKPTPPKPEGEGTDPYFELMVLDPRFDRLPPRVLSASIAKGYYDRCHKAESDLSAARATITSLRAALEPFAKEAPEWKIYEDGEQLVESFPQVDSQITVGDLRRALAALAPASSGKGEG